MSSKAKNTIYKVLPILSLVNMFFLAEWVNFLGEPVKDILGTPTPFKNAYFAISGTVLALGILIFSVTYLLEKFKFRKWNVFVHLVLLLSLVSTLNFLREVSGLFYEFPSLSRLVNSLVYQILMPHKAASIVFTFAFALIVVGKLNGHIIAITRLLGFVLSPLILVCYGNLVVSYWRSNLYDPQPKFSGNKEIASSDIPKLVWIIFDEMDYRLTFDNRPKGLKLPELDRLKRDSLFFNRAYPPADRTIHSIPSLLSGTQWNVIETTPTDLTLQGTENFNLEAHFATIPNVFRQVKELGYKTGLVGWYHNYCRNFKNDLDYCRRFPAGRFGYAEDLWGSVQVILSRSLSFEKRYEKTFIFNLDKAISVGSQRISSGVYSLFFVHLSIPHAPWIYDAENKKLSTNVPKEPNQYFANLQLVDKTFGDFRRALESSGEWSKTTVIVSSDHSWRESTLYDGRRDFRVPYLIKMPDGKGDIFAKPTATILTKAFILEIMSKQITRTEQAKKWFDKNTNSFPSGTVINSKDIISEKNSDDKNSGLDSPQG